MANRIDRVRAPQLFRNLLPRKQIAELINHTPLDEAVCIVAPYGYGKTVAVLSWLRAHSGQAAWFTLDEADGAESSFAEGVAAALLPFASEPDDVRFLSSPPQAADVRTFLLDAAARIVGGRISADALILDQLHLLRDGRLLGSVKEFIRLLLGYVRVILISRTELPPVFNDLILKRQICQITIKELSFDAAEIAEYFARNGCPISPETAQRTLCETEGWPAALNAILTISCKGTVEYGEAARAYIKGFFETEIWGGLEENTKDFLLRTSVLDKLTPAVCHALTGVGATLPILTWLFTNGLFLSKLEKNTYRYHCVFRDFLRDKLASSHITERELYRKAAWWCFERDDFEQSFLYFFKAGELYGLSRVLRVLTPANMSIEDFLELSGCITTLDVAELKPYPLILARMVLIQYLLGNIDEMRRLNAVFREWTEPGELLVSPDEYGEYLWEVGWLDYLNPDEAVLGNKKHEEWSNYREYVPDLKPFHTLRFSALRFPSALRGIRDYCSVVDSIDAFVAHNEATGRSAIREEYALYEMELIQAEYAYETENYQKAGQLLRNIMPRVEARKITALYFICTVLLVKLARATRGGREIEKLTERLESIILANGETYLLPNFHAFQQRNWLMEGRLGFTDVFLRENRDLAGKSYYYLLYRHIAYARGLLSMGNFHEALLMLGALDILCRKYKRTMDGMEVGILRAVALYGLGHENDARQCLTDVLDEAKPYGFIRIFSDDARDLHPILALVWKQRNDAYVKNIIISCKKTLSRSGAKTLRSRSELTKAEQKILRSLQAGMSYQEISLDHGIKISTVKSHAHSIYSKLQVSNRTAAVFAAQNAGILDGNLVY